MPVKRKAQCLELARCAGHASKDHQTHKLTHTTSTNSAHPLVVAQAQDAQCLELAHRAGNAGQATVAEVEVAHGLPLRHLSARGPPIAKALCPFDLPHALELAVLQQGGHEGGGHLYSFYCVCVG